MRSIVKFLPIVLLGLVLAAPALAQEASVADRPPTTAEGAIDLLEVPADLTLDDVDLPTALAALFERSEVRVAYSPSLIASHAVSCDCADVSVGAALDRMLLGTGLRYTAVGKQVLVEPGPKPVLPREERTLMFAAATPLDVTSLQGPSNRSIRSSTRTRRALDDEQQGVISGRVVDSRSRQPLTAVQVTLGDTGLETLTSGNGQFSFSSAPAGTHILRAERLGYRAETREVSVAPNETTEVNLDLTQEALALEEVIVTGTPGGTQRRAIGNVVASVNAEELMDRTPILQVDQILGQRTPGLIMLPGTGQIGESGAVRIRGISSITQGAEPIVYIDGVRMDSELGGRGGAVSSLNDINPADIASMEIIKGPAAATLYGTEASNGVIQIITRRGTTGRPQFEVTTRLGTNWMWNPEGRAGLRYMRDPENPGELIGSNVYEQERLHGTGPIFNYGMMQGYNLSMRGGTEVLRYFGSVSRNHDVGIVSHNWDRRIGVRGNAEVLLTENLRVQLGTAYVQRQTRMSEGEASVRPFRNLIWAVPENTAARGWRTSPPEEWDKVETRNDNDRITANLELRYQPVSWSNHRLVAGLDANSIADWTLIPRMPQETMHFYGASGQGSKVSRRGHRRLVTLDYAGSVDINWRDYSFQPAVGFQYYKTETSFITASGSQFPAIPITTISGGAARSGEETFLQNATVGVYAQQQVGWNERAFVTVAVRADDNSAFGVDFDAAIYPKLSGTWVISEEPFWNLDLVEQLRVRTAWGAAGQQPGTFDASQLYSPAIGHGDQPGVSPSSFGNPELKPERSEELEFGFDASLLGGRLDLEYTRYQKSVKDAIINRPLPLSSGFIGSQVVNVGLIENWGNEFGMNARLVEGSRFGWSLDAQLATSNNEIKRLGESDVIFAGTQSQHRTGYSIADMFMIRILSAEIDGNGQVLSATCDGGTGPRGLDPGGAPVPCGQAPQVWLGHSQPTWQIGVGNSFTLFNDFTLSLRVEGNGGHKHNATEVRATHNLNTTEAVLRANDPIFLAYRSLENDRTGVYDAGFLRLREVALTYVLPGAALGRIGAERGSLTLGMRNVAMLWTAQHGWSTPRDGHIREGLADMIVWDPETRGSGSTSVGFQQNVPQTASATFSLRLSF